MADLNRPIAATDRRGSSQKPARHTRCFIAPHTVDEVTLTHHEESKDIMKYGIAWLLGVPASLLVVWYVVSHVL